MQEVLQIWTKQPPVFITSIGNDADEPDLKVQLSKKDIDIDLKDPEVAAAAKKIQAAFRGHKTKNKQLLPPKFLKELKDVEVCVDSAVSLDCQIIGDPEPDIIWYKDEEEIHESEHIYFEFSDDNFVSLIITSVEEDDDGTYTCEATNSVGAASSIADIFVEEFTEVQKETADKLKKPVTTLPLPLPSTSNNTKEKIVQTVPEFILKLRSKTVEVDSITKLSVTVTGNPYPEIQWEKEGTVLETGEHYEIFEENGAHNLEIYDTDICDDGKYTCIATNTIGSVSCSCQVRIAG
ncbi:SPEG neighbor protein-like [Saccoglossus kowalevskii]